MFHWMLVRGITLGNQRARTDKQQDNCMYTYTLRHGIDKSTKSFDSAQTVRQLRANESFKAGLGYGDNVNLVLNGVTMEDDVFPPNNAELAVETRCNTKATS